MSMSLPNLEQSSQFTPELTIVGDAQGLPEGTFPLGQCQGDCDDDSECADGLACFQRDDYEMVPGCSGKGERKTDYCYDPTLDESIEATTAPPGTTEETTTSEF